jgi:receptor protein-tyrosine kinase
MGIIEKAVDRESKGRGDDGQPAAATEKPRQRRSGDLRTGDSTGTIVATQHLAMVGPSASTHHPELERDFKFLKRPLLSRIFGLSGGNTSPGHFVLVTSDAPGAGKSFVSVNLAASIAQEQLTKVILIDADPLRRNLSVALRQDDQPGLLEIIADSSVNPESVALQTDVPSLRFVPAGQPQPNSTELLASPRLIDVLTALDDPDTVILLDSSPLLVTAEARVLAERVDHTVVVVEAGRSSVADVAAMMKMLSQAGSSINMILNKTPKSASGGKGGYYQYGLEYGPATEQT